MSQSLKDLLAGKAPTSAAPPAAAASAAPVVIPQGATSAETLKNTLAAFAAQSGKARVNPPEAAQVLATKTANEVAGGKEEPELDGSEVEPPTTKPADVVAAENAPKTRRTAAVVQAELDAALEELAAAKKALATHEAAPDPKPLADAREMIEALRAEAKVADEDLKKAHARADALQETADLAEQLGAALQQARAELEATLAAKPGAASLGLATTKQLSDALAAQGFKVSLEVGPA